MTFISRVAIRNRRNLRNKVDRILGVEETPNIIFKKMFICMVVPLFVLKTVISFVLEASIFIMGFIADGIDYIIELINDLYRLCEDIICITLIKLMRLEDKEDE